MRRRARARAKRARRPLPTCILTAAGAYGTRSLCSWARSGEWNIRWAARKRRKTSRRVSLLFVRPGCPPLWVHCRPRYPHLVQTIIGLLKSCASCAARGVRPLVRDRARGLRAAAGRSRRRGREADALRRRSHRPVVPLAGAAPPARRPTSNANEPVCGASGRAVCCAVRRGVCTARAVGCALVPPVSVSTKPRLRRASHRSTLLPSARPFQACPPLRTRRIVSYRAGSLSCEGPCSAVEELFSRQGTRAGGGAQHLRPAAAHACHAIPVERMPSSRSPVLTTPTPPPSLFRHRRHRRHRQQ